MPDNLFLSLPAELRLRIYEYALQFPGVLQRPLRASAWRDFTGYLVNTPLLSVCKQVHEEARDVFHEVNEFRISYNHMCTCQNRFPFSAFNEQRIRKLEVCNFLPRVDEPKTCQFCRQSGFGLISYLKQLPKLRSAKVSFEDIFSFTDFGPELLRRLSGDGRKIELSCEEVGQVEVLGLSVHLEFKLPAMHRAWLCLAGRLPTHTSRLPGQKTMERALEYLQFEANTYDRTSSALKPFFVPSEEDETLTLRFQRLPDKRKRRADFTIALAGVLNDIFADDGGSESIDWVDLDGGIYGGRWQFNDVHEPIKNTGDRASVA